MADDDKNIGSTSVKGPASKVGTKPIGGKFSCAAHAAKGAVPPFLRQKMNIAKDKAQKALGTFTQEFNKPAEDGKTGMRGMVQNLTEGNITKALMPGILRPKTTQSTPPTQAPSDTTKPSDTTTHFNVKNFISKHDEGSFMHKALTSLSESAKKQGKEPTEAQMKAAEEGFKTLAEDQSFKDQPDTIKKEVF